MSANERVYGVATPEQIAGMSGREALEAMIAGRLPAPPIARLMGFELVEVGDGLAIFEGTPFPDLLNPLGVVHGGWALTLIDSAAGCAGHATLAPGYGYTSVETKANFARPIAPDTGKVRAEGRVLTAGRRIIATEARITDSRGRIVAHGTSTLIVFPPGG
ncbi:PaaI family thioesterase [Edaphosphingomonas haloaromaticamans]|uniref:Thioesterase superfamily protein n=1 Tax=Edaphosphingomonas haloaromaticamans TaxID=653954 RepID=A0A1S1HHP1_9SPHN|nr:PaaI family thioesterase [Sphingomonas haloaromaticamans]OHT21568.1 Thioesterase superfamily protein [Sphingomonas haloaromaticamans]